MSGTPSLSEEIRGVIAVLAKRPEAFGHVEINAILAEEGLSAPRYAVSRALSEQIRKGVIIDITHLNTASDRRMYLYQGKK